MHSAAREEVWPSDGQAIAEHGGNDSAILVPLRSFGGPDEVAALQGTEELIAIGADCEIWKQLADRHFALARNTISDLHEEILLFPREIADVIEEIGQHFSNRVSLSLKRKAGSGQLYLKEHGADDQEDKGADQDDGNADVDKVLEYDLTRRSRN